MIHVAVGIVLNVAGEILVAERASHKHQGGMWEFPGGKVEPGETTYDALQRELAEEINIQVTKATEWMKFPYEYADKKLLLDTWIVTAFEGEAHGREGQAIRWVAPDQLFTLQIPDANIVIIKKLLEFLD
jgi:8-oxo-dGTP diphosphatase